MNSCCGSNTNIVVKGGQDCGRYFPQYKPCGECGMPNGYPKGACVELCVEVDGKKSVYIAKSKEADNKSAPSFDNADWDIRPLCGWFGAGQDGEDGEDGITPRVGKNGNWFIGNTDTGVPATGPKGDKGEPGTGGNSADGVITDATVDNTKPALELSRSEGLSSLTVPLCDISHLERFVIKPNRVYKGRYHKENDQTFPSHPDDNHLNIIPIQKVKISHPELVALGMRPTDNAVRITTFVGAALNRDETDPAIGSEARIVVQGHVVGCDGGWLTNTQSNASLLELDVGDGEAANENLSKDVLVPLNSDGSIELIYRIGRKNVKSVPAWTTSFDVHVFAFERIANGCFKAEKPKCYGISGN